MSDDVDPFDFLHGDRKKKSLLPEAVRTTLEKGFSEDYVDGYLSMRSA